MLQIIFCRNKSGRNRPAAISFGRHATPGCTERLCSAHSSVASCQPQALGDHIAFNRNGPHCSAPMRREQLVWNQECGSASFEITCSAT